MRDRRIPGCVPDDDDPGFLVGAPVNLTGGIAGGVARRATGGIAAGTAAGISAGVSGGVIGGIPTGVADGGTDGDTGRIARDVAGGTDTDGDGRADTLVTDDGFDLLVHTDLDADGIADRLLRIGLDGVAREVGVPEPEDVPSGGLLHGLLGGPDAGGLDP